MMPAFAALYGYPLGHADHTVGRGDRDDGAAPGCDQVQGSSMSGEV